VIADRTTLCAPESEAGSMAMVLTPIPRISVKARIRAAFSAPGGGGSAHETSNYAQSLLLLC